MGQLVVPADSVVGVSNLGRAICYTGAVVGCVGMALFFSAQGMAGTWALPICIAGYFSVRDFRRWWEE